MANEFWAFSLSIYAAEGVAESCLSVQDQQGVDVNVLLYAGWLAAGDRLLTSSHLAALEACIGEWRERVVVPLRCLRRALRDYPLASSVREQIKSLELESERRQQDLMWEHFQAAEALPSARHPLAANLALLVDPAVARSGAWADLVARLLATPHFGR